MQSKMAFVLITLIYTFSFPSFAHLIEADGRIGFSRCGDQCGLASFTANNNISNGANGSAGQVMTIFGIDALVSIPTMNVGVGIRYDSLGSQDFGNGSTQLNFSLSRWALLVDYKIMLLEGLYVGPIASFGLSHKGNINATSANGTKFNFNGGTGSSSSLAFESGVIFTHLHLGIELGYENWTQRDMVDDYGGTKQSLDASTIYFALKAGAVFL